TLPDSALRQASVQWYGRVTSISGRFVNEFDEEMSFAPSAKSSGLLLQRQLLLSPGRFRLEVILKDEVGGKFGTAVTAISIPTQLHGRTKISSLILAQRIDFLQTMPEKVEPYL